MFYERHKNRFSPGGTSVHRLWPVELQLRWSTDWELRYLPPVFEICLAILAVVILLIASDIMVRH
jgi:hypothetical protein